MGNYAQIDTTLFGLGNSLIASFQFSNKQRERFLFALERSGLLTYQRDYSRALDNAEDKGRDAKVAVEKSLDGVRWTIELNGWLQAKTLIVATHLASQIPSERQHVKTVAELLNTAHLTAGRADEEDKLGIKNLRSLKKKFT